MSEREEEFDNIIPLIDENGKETEFEWLDTVEMGDEHYVILLPVEDEEAEEVVILRIESNGDEEEENLVPVENEEELNKVYDIFKERNKENFDFVD